MSDPIESEEIEGAPTGEIEDEVGDEGEGAEVLEGETTSEPAPRQVEEAPTSTLAIALAVEQAELKVERLEAVAQQKREVLTAVEGSIAEAQAELARIDQLDTLTLEDVHCLENARRKLRRLESDRTAALENLAAAESELATANKALGLAELWESEDRLRRLTDSVGATILVFSKHLRALCEEVLSFADEVQASAPFGYHFKAPCGFPFRSQMSRVLPALPGPGYPRSPAREAMELLQWLAREPLRLAAGNDELEKRWVVAPAILIQEDPTDGRPN